MDLWAALTKGEGTPWGAMQTGKPAFPAQSLSAYEGMDTTAQGQAGRARIGKQAAGAREQALARLRQAGVKGADTGAAIANVAGQQTDALGNLEAQLQNMDMQAREANRRAALDKYTADMMAFAGEQKGRGDFWNSLANLGGTAAGAYLGRK